MEIITVLPRSSLGTGAASGAYPGVARYGAENATAECWTNPQVAAGKRPSRAGVTETTGLPRLAIAAPARRSRRSIMPSSLASMPAEKPRQ